MSYGVRFNSFLKTNSEIEKKFIVNYKKNISEQSLIEYCCSNNIYNWIKILKSYSDIDILEYYTKCKNPTLKIVKLLNMKYKKNYIQNVILYSCEEKIIEYFLYFDNSNKFCFNLLIELNNKKMFQLFLKYGYKVDEEEIELLIKKNITFSEMYSHIYKWINIDSKNLYFIFKYTNDIELLDYLLIHNVDFNNKDLYQKDILIYTCENVSIDLKLIKKTYKLLNNYNINSTDILNNNALYYYCLNENFQSEIFEYLKQLNFNLNNDMKKRLLEHTLNHNVLNVLEKYNFNIISFKYNINNLSQDVNFLKFYDSKYGLYNYVDINELIFLIIESQNYDGLIYLIDNNNDLINIQDKHQNTILNLICQNKKKPLPIIEYLVSKGVDVYCKNIFGFNCIFTLLNSIYCDFEIYKYLINIDKIDQSYNFNKERISHQICKLNLDYKYLQVLSNRCINYNLVDTKNNTALNYALMSHNLRNIEYFLKLDNIDLKIKNNIGFNALDYFLKSDAFNSKYLIYFKSVTLKNIENYITNKNFNVKIFAYLVYKLKKRFESNYEGNNILLMVSKTYFNNTKTKIKIYQILKNLKFNFNKVNYNNENALILNMKYDQNYYIIKYLLSLKVSSLTRDKRGNNALIYSKSIGVYNLLNKVSIKRTNFKGQNILIHLFEINYLSDVNFITELSKIYKINMNDKFIKNILDYFIENKSNNIEMFDFILNFIDLKKTHINQILKSYNSKLCIYLLNKNKLDVNYLDYYKFGILDYFSHDKEIINLVIDEYQHKIKNKNIIISHPEILKFIEDKNYFIFKTDNLNLKQIIISQYNLNSNTIIKLLDNNYILPILINYKIDLTFLDQDNNNILLILLKKNYNLNHIKLLIENVDLNINLTNNQGKNALFYSFYDFEIFKYLVSNECDYTVLDFNLESLLSEGIKNQVPLNFITYLIEDCECNINHKNISNEHYIFYTKKYNIIKYLLSKGLDTNIKDNYGNTFLNYYLQSYDLDINIIELFVEYKYNFDTLNNNHYTPLINYLKYHNSIYILSIILNNQKSINFQDLTGGTALHTAIKRNLNIQIINVLIKFNINVNILDNFNKNVLFYCKNDNYLPIIKKIVQSGINYNLIVEDRNYLMFCGWWNMEKTLKYLVDYSQINIHHLDNHNNNILFYVTGLYSEQGNLELLNFLIDKGIDYKHINNDGYNLLFVAAGVGGYNYYDHEIMKYLLQMIELEHLDKENNTFLSYLEQEYLEFLVEEKILNNQDKVVMEQIYSKNIVKLMPYELVFKFKEMRKKECGICMDNFGIFDILVECPNKHTFHRDCLIKWYKESGKIKCPYCTLRFPLTHNCIKCL
jgi:hypothetical protein